LEAFSRARDEGAEGVICVTLSAGLSGTYQAAVTGAAELAGSMAIEVVDSRAVTLAEGFLVLDAAEAAAQGHSLSEVADLVRARAELVHILGGLDSLDTLRRGGRIGPAQAFFGSLLAIKPIVELREGVVEGESRQRTRSRSLRYLADKVLAAGPVRRLGVSHATASDVDQFLELTASVTPEFPLIVTHLGAVIGAHTGPGTIGVSYELAG